MLLPAGGVKLAFVVLTTAIAAVSADIILPEWARGGLAWEKHLEHYEVSELCHKTP